MPTELIDTEPRPIRSTQLAEELAGLDALEEVAPRQGSVLSHVWTAVWPRLLAVLILIASWEAVVQSHWKPDYVLPGPRPVFSRLGELAGTSVFWRAIGVTMQRALVGYLIAVLIGSGVGLAVSRFATLRAAVGSFITGLQTMPSIAWFPLAILLFQLSEGAIVFVVVLGAAPSVANGLLSGVDNVPPLLTRAGRVLGARGLAYYRHVVLPAALTGYVSGLKQGWAFAWRSLMAGELIVIVANRPSIGARLQFARELSDAPGLLALMIVVLIIGIVVDTVFGQVDLAIRHRRGLTRPGTSPGVLFILMRVR